MALPVWLNRANQWVNQRSLKALEKAYQQAGIIKNLEDRHLMVRKFPLTAIAARAFLTISKVV